MELETARRTRDELRVLTRGLLTVQEEERKRISRELHDVVSQALTAINLRLATLDIQTTGDAEEMHRKIALTQALVEKSVATVHRFARDLRPSALNDLGLIPALAAFIKGYEAESGVAVEFKAAAGVEGAAWGDSRCVVPGDSGSADECDAACEGEPGAVGDPADGEGDGGDDCG